jgi:thiol:disulfide interchange protein DsbD
MKSLLTALVLFGLLAGAPAEGQSTGIDLALVAETKAIRAGQAFYVGLHIRHREGYHTYWRNPGIVGMATSLDWDLPEGFTAGPIEWPHPEMVDMAGHPAHGYHREVLLMTRITPPAKLSAEEITLSAACRWMACARTCHPGATSLSLRLPVTTETPSPSARQKLFARARTELPQELAGFTVSVRPGTAPATIELYLQATAAQAPVLEDLYFFSHDGQVSSDQPQVLHALGKGRYRLRLKRSEFGPPGAPTFPGTLRAAVPLGPGGRKFASINPAHPAKNTPDP